MEIHANLCLVVVLELHQEQYQQSKHLGVWQCPLTFANQLMASKQDWEKHIQLRGERFAGLWTARQACPKTLDHRDAVCPLEARYWDALLTPKAL